jgi:putative phage-type endonuclease
VIAQIVSGESTGGAAPPPAAAHAAGSPDTHSDAWHAERATGIGGSDIGVLLGLSRWQSPWSLWCEKVGLLPARGPETQRQRIGRRMEAVIAAEFHDATGLWVAGEQTMLRSTTHPFARSTPDGFVVESEHSSIDDALGIFEAKTDGRFGWDEIPPAHLAQVRWSMGVAGLDRAWLAVMFAGWRFEVFEVDQDPADWEFMVAKAEWFWDLVQTQTPPPIDSSDATAHAIRDRWPSHVDGAIHDASPDLAALLARRKAVNEQMLRTEKEVKRLTAELAAAIGEAELIAVGGTPAWSYRSQSRTTLDAKALQAAHPELDLTPFQRTSTFRVLREIPPTNKEAR